MFVVAVVVDLRVAVAVLAGISPELAPTLEQVTPMQVRKNKTANNTEFCVRNAHTFSTWVFTSVFKFFAYPLCPVCYQEVGLGSCSNR